MYFPPLYVLNGIKLNSVVFFFSSSLKLFTENLLSGALRNERQRSFISSEQEIVQGLI